MMMMMMMMMMGMMRILLQTDLVSHWTDGID